MSLNINEITFEWVDKTENKNLLKKALKLLKDDGGYFPDLEKKIEWKIYGNLDELAKKNKEEKEKASNDLLNWEKEIEKKDINLNSKLNNDNKETNELTNKDKNCVIQDSSNNDNKLENTERKQLLLVEKQRIAESLKIKGNELLKENKVSNALQMYTNSIEYYPNESTTYCNRALCYIKLKDYQKCIDDCNKAIDLSTTKNYSKAYFRRASAYIELNEFKKGLIDYKYLLDTIPDNLDIINKIKEAKEKWNKLKGNDIANKEYNRIFNKEINENNTLNSNKIKIDIIENNNDEDSNKNKISKFKRIKIEEDNKDKTENILNSENINNNKTNSLNILKQNTQSKSNENDINNKKTTLLKNNNSCNDSNNNKNNKLNLDNNNNNTNNQIKNNTKMCTEKINSALNIASKDLDFTFYKINSSGFEQALKSFINSNIILEKDNRNKFIEFLNYYNLNNFKSVFSKNELSIENILIFCNLIKKSETSIKNNTNYYDIAFDYSLSIPKTRNFMIKKIMLKNKKELLEDSFSVFNNKSDQISLIKLYI